MFPRFRATSQRGLRLHPRQSYDESGRVTRALFDDAVSVIRARRIGTMRIEAEPNAADFYQPMGEI